MNKIFVVAPLFSQAERDCNVVVAILDGIDVEAGVGFELGYAHAKKKQIIGLKTDYRTFSRKEEIISF